jgi:hypothetical protein
VRVRNLLRKLLPQARPVPNGPLDIWPDPTERTDDSWWHGDMAALAPAATAVPAPSPLLDELLAIGAQTRHLRFLSSTEHNPEQYQLMARAAVQDLLEGWYEQTDGTGRLDDLLQPMPTSRRKALRGDEQLAVAPSRAETREIPWWKRAERAGAVTDTSPTAAAPAGAAL